MNFSNINPRKCLKFLALILAIFLTITDLTSFMIEKPTNTVLSTKPGTAEDTPDILVCPYPAYNMQEVDRNGFAGFVGYLFGILRAEELTINSGGKQDEDPVKISRNMQVVKNLNDLVYRVRIVTKGEDSSEVKNNTYFKTFDIKKFDRPGEKVLTSSGFCFRLILPKLINQGLIRNIKIFLNNTYMEAKNISTASIGLEENNARKRVLKLLPHAMTGDKIVGQSRPAVIKYKIKILKFKFRKSCRSYERGESVETCYEKVGFKEIKEILGCLPLELTNNTDTNICKGAQNLTDNKYEDILTRLDNYVGYEACPNPCSYYEYNVMMVKHQMSTERIFELVFTKSIYVTTSEYQYTFIPILTTVGGHIGVCRTLVWIGVTMVGAKKIYGMARRLVRAPLILKKERKSSEY